jgi:hypothetical protein
MKYPMVWLGAFLVVMSFAAANIYGNWLPTYLLDIKVCVVDPLLPPFHIRSLRMGPTSSLLNLPLFRASLCSALLILASSLFSSIHCLTQSASPTSARYSLAALWGGIALGRVVLAYPSSRFGEKPVSMTSLVLFMVALAILWKVKDVQAEQGIVFASGFCLGPGERSLPKDACCARDRKRTTAH